MNEVRGFKAEIEKGKMPSGSLRIRMKGNFTTPITRKFSHDFDRVITQGYRRVELELTELLYLDSTGIAAIVSAHRKMTEAEGVLILRNPRKLIHHLFVSAKLDTILTILTGDEEPPAEEGLKEHDTEETKEDWEALGLEDLDSP